MIVIKESPVKEKKTGKEEYAIKYDYSNLARPVLYINEKGTSKQLFQFFFGVSGTPYCCGLKEMGGFTVYNYDNTLPEDVKVKHVAKLIEDMVPKYTNSESGRCMTILFTLIDGVNACSLVRLAIADKPIFKMVKQFVNSNTGRRNDLFIVDNGFIK